MTITDKRFNRNYCMCQYTDMCKEIVKRELNLDRSDLHCTSMSWDEFKAVSYKQNYLDVQVDCTINFNTGTLTIEVR